MPREQVKQARKWCWNCPVQRDCLLSALQSDERQGIWGGFTTNERMRVKHLTNSLSDALAHFDQGTLYALVVKLRER